MFRLLRTILFIISADKNSHNVNSAADGCISCIQNPSAAVLL